MKEKPLIDIRAEGDAVIVAFKINRINEFRLAEGLDRQLKQIARERQFEKMILDCGNLDYVVSEVFTNLLQLANLLKRDGRRIFVCNLTPFLNEIYTTMRFEAVIPVKKNLEEALRE